MTKLKALVKQLESTKVKQQVFRFARLVAVGVVTAYITHSAIDTASVTALVETAFRQVFEA